MIHPFLVLEIPFYGFLDTLLKLERWLPTQFLLQLSRVDGVTHIVTLSVCYIGDEVHILAFLSAEQSINGLDNHLDDIDVLPLVETAIARDNAIRFINYLFPASSSNISTC